MDWLAEGLPQYRAMERELATLEHAHPGLLLLAAAESDRHWGVAERLPTAYADWRGIHEARKKFHADCKATRKLATPAIKICETFWLHFAFQQRVAVFVARRLEDIPAGLDRAAKFNAWQAARREQDDAAREAFGDFGAWLERLVALYWLEKGTAPAALALPPPPPPLPSPKLRVAAAR